MLGGIGLLVLLALISRALSDVGFEALFRAVLNRLRAKGLSIEEISQGNGRWLLVHFSDTEREAEAVPRLLGQAGLTEGDCQDFRVTGP